MREALYRELLSLFPGRVKAEEPLKKHTSWRIGGPAEFFFEPAGRRELQILVSFAHEKGIPLTVIGNGSNLLVSDHGIRGIVVKIYRNLGNMALEGIEIRSEAGASLARVVALALNAGLSGLAFLTGIPGTVGGAIAMNAGAYGSSAGDLVREVLLLGFDGRFEVKSRDEMDFGYRSSILQREPAIVVEVSLALKQGKPEDIRRDMKEYLTGRKNSQPLNMPSAGSVFKNPPGHFAGRLIELTGLKGFSVGGAQVSQKHANFIVNLGGATAQDVAELIDMVRGAVLDNFGLELELEVKFLGQWQS